MTSITTTADLLRLLREDPDFRDEVRRLVLSQELLELPERFARFEAYVERQFAEVRADIARLDEGQAQMRQDITEIRGDITVMQGDITKNTSDIGSLKGAEYERRVGKSFASYASMAFRQRHGRRLRRNHLLYSNILGRDSGFDDLISEAVDDGMISDDDKADLEQADAVMSGQDGGDTVYYVGEISITVNNRDIDRAIARAEILAKVTGCDALPMVIGATIPAPQRERAEAERVAYREIEE